MGENENTYCEINFLTYPPKMGYVTSKLNSLTLLLLLIAQVVRPPEPELEMVLTTDRHLPNSDEH